MMVELTVRKGAAMITALSAKIAPRQRLAGEGAPMASTRDWFETVAEAHAGPGGGCPGRCTWPWSRARSGVTLRDNVAAFRELRFAPPLIADLPAPRELATSVLGQPVSLPVIASPTGVQAVHPEGEVAVARGDRRGRHRDGPERVRQQAGRRGGGRQSEDCSSRSTGQATATRCVQRIERARPPAPRR